LPSLRSIEVQIPFYDHKRNPDRSKPFSQTLSEEMVTMFQSHYLSYAWLSHLAKQVSQREANHVTASTFWESYSTLFDQVSDFVAVMSSCAANMNNKFAVGNQLFCGAIVCI
jgi:hypothetical protein